MFIKRDITKRLAESRLPVQVLIGPRQVGKSTLLYYLSDNTFKEISFDDLQLRQLANRDPALFLEQFRPPLILDEVQYAPNLFSEIKKQIDQLKRHRLETNQELDVSFRMTGSNQILMDKNIKESLAGRASYFYLNTLTVHEILQTFPEMSLQNILFRGGWPELYIDLAMSPVQYLNDYIRSYIEKDIILSAGIERHNEFNTMLSLLAARTGMILNYTDIAKNSGIKSVTVKAWIGLLEQTQLISCLRPYSNNFNKRLVKSPKLYFMDTGLAVRLQGWRDKEPLAVSPQMGAIFETLVFAEIKKFIENYNKDWELYFWRTRDGDEVDFVIVTEDHSVIVLDAKLSMQSVRPVKLPKNIKQDFPACEHIILVTFGGEQLKLTKECSAVPIQQLHDYLQLI